MTISPCCLLWVLDSDSGRTLQAFTKARGDGLGFDFLKADFTLHASLNSGASHGTATVAIDGVPSTRCRPCSGL